LGVLVSAVVIPNRGANVSRAADAPKDGDRYSETVPSSLVTFEMIKVPGKKWKNADGKEIETKTLWWGKCEVTWDEYDVWVFQMDMSDAEKAKVGVDAKTRPSRPYGTADGGWGHHNFPAMRMSFLGADEYCKWLSARTGKKYRLPTEEEWEFACREAEDAKDKEPDDETLKKIAWYAENSDDQTHAVGTKEGNKLGLFDLYGNVAEWVTTADGKTLAAGGAYEDDPADLGPVARKKPKEGWNVTDPQNPKSKWWLADAPFVGFRLVREE
jgi:formylglycine-generating enzyme required for sulfatase activity